MKTALRIHTVYKSIVLVFFLILIIILHGCTNKQPEALNSHTKITRWKENMYTFTPLTHRPSDAFGSKLDVPSLTIEKIIAGNGTYMARFRGSLLTLFGEPLESSMDALPLFTYVIQAQDQTGQRWLFTAYHGPSGPAFGSTDHSAAAIDAAEALLALIEQTAPTTFTATWNDDDTGSAVTYGCAAGQCFWREAE